MMGQISSGLGRGVAAAGLWWAIAGGGPAWADGASSEPAEWTEAWVIDRARAAAKARAVAAAQARAQRGQAKAAGLHPDPTLGWNRERAGSDGEGEDSLFVTVPLDFSGRRGTRAGALAVNEALSEARAAIESSRWVEAAVRALYRSVANEARSDALARFQARMAAAAKVVLRRVEAGTAPRQDAARMAVEAALAEDRRRMRAAEARRSRLALAERLRPGAAAAEARAETQMAPVARLALAPEASPSVEGPDLDTAEPETGAPANPEVDGARRSLAAFARAEARADRARSSADWSWLPQFSVSGGYRRVIGARPATGYVAGATARLPVFDRGQADRVRGRALAVQARRARRGYRADLRRRARLAELEMRAHRARLTRLDAAARAHDAVLARASDAAYREGAMSLSDWVAAEKTRTELSLAQIDAAWALRQAEISWRAARGAFE